MFNKWLDEDTVNEWYNKALSDEQKLWVKLESNDEQLGLLKATLNISYAMESFMVS